MILSFPFSFGFGLLSVVGSLLAISAGHWLGVWLGLEINLLGFIPLMVQGFGNQSVESAVKYFIVQALGSGFLLLGGFCLGNSCFMWFVGSSSPLLFCFCFFGLFLKLGVAPFHWWVPSVMGGLSWFACGMLATWQKLAPFFVLSSLCYMFSSVFFFFGLFSAVLGGIMGVGQVQLRLLMAYSSVAHWGWIVSILGVSSVGGICYFLIYFLLSGGVFYFLAVSGVWRVNQLSGVMVSFIAFGFLSLGGLPPFTGFLPKWVGLSVLMASKSFLLSFFLIVGSLFSLYYYLSFLFLVFLSSDCDYSFFYSKVFRFWVSVGLVVFLMGAPFYEVMFYLF